MKLASPAHMSYRYVDKFFRFTDANSLYTSYLQHLLFAKVFENNIYATTTIVATAVLSMSDIYAKFAK